MELKYVSLNYAKDHAQPAWLVQYRGRGKFLTPWVRLCCGGWHTHSALVTGYNRISEIREFKGGRISTFDYQYSVYKGTMDFFSIAPQYHNLAGEFATAEAMEDMANRCKYAYSNILNMALRKIPGFHLLFDAGVYDDRPNEWKTHRHCSEAVAAALAYGLVDPCPRVPNALVTPHDLTRSMLFSYSFSL